jgi:Ran-binding protein 9/10
MTSRPTRSSSVSVPPRGGISNSPARHIESVISIPGTQSRPRIVNQGGPQRSPNVGISSVRGSSSMAVASSPPMRSTARSFTQPSSSVLSGTGTAPTHVYYEPRVIRADTTCPTSSSVLPSHARRASGTGVRAPSSHRPALAIPSAGPMVIDVAPFSRPAYLDQSALRHLLQTDTPPQLASSPKPEPAVARTDYGVNRRRSHRSPSSDSDEEDMSHSGELSSRQQETILMSPAPLRLPTRWSEEYRSSLLSVSTDGRDLSYQGQFMPRQWNYLTCHAT